MGNSVVPEDHTEFITRLRFSNHHMLYLESSARIRGISVQGLVRKLMHIIARDQLVLSIADGDDLRKIDDGQTVRDRVPSDKLFDAVTSRPTKQCIVTEIDGVKDNTVAPKTHKVKTMNKTTLKSPSLAPRHRHAASVPMHRSFNGRVFNKHETKTKEELRRELAEAVRNTAAMPVED